MKGNFSLFMLWKSIIAVAAVNIFEEFTFENGKVSSNLIFEFNDSWFHDIAKLEEKAKISDLPVLIALKMIEDENMNR